MITTQITGRNYGQIGQIGQSAGFTDFTVAQMATDGYAFIAQRSTEFDFNTIFSGKTTDTDGKLELVAETESAVYDYLITVFDATAQTVDAKVFIHNVVFATKPDAAVVDKDSNYVDRSMIVTVYWTVKTMTA